MRANAMGMVVAVRGELSRGSGGWKDPEGGDGPPSWWKERDADNLGMVTRLRRHGPDGNT